MSNADSQVQHSSNESSDSTQSNVVEPQPNDAQNSFLVDKEWLRSLIFDMNEKSMEKFRKEFDTLKGTIKNPEPQSRSNRPHSKSKHSHSRPSRSKSRRDHRRYEHSRSRSKSNSRNTRSPSYRSRDRSSRSTSRISSSSDTNKSRLDERSRSREYSGSPFRAGPSHKRDRTESGDERSVERSRSRDHGKRTRYNSPSEDGDSFPYQGETYVYYNKNRHQLVQDNTNQVVWNGEILTVKWHGSSRKPAFCQVKTLDSSEPYLKKDEACDCLCKKLGLGPWLGKSPGLKRKAYSTSFDPESGMGEALKAVHSNEDTLIHSLLSGNKKKALKAGSDFNDEAPVLTVFSNGWPKDNYFEWAKGYNLDLEHTAKVLDLNHTKKVPELLEAEKDNRAYVADQITGIRTIELLADEFKEDESTRKAILAIARIFLSNLRPLIINWMDAKLTLRREILHHQTTDTARILLKSSMWTPHIFSNESLKEAGEAKNKVSLRKLLNLNEDGSYNEPSFNKNNGSSGKTNSKRPKDFNNKRNHNRREHFNKHKSFRHNEKDKYPSNKSQETQGNSQKGKKFNGGKGKKHNHSQR